MIEIKAFFGPWTEVTEEKAKSFIKSFMAGMVACSDPEKRISIVEALHLRGISVSELLVKDD